MEFSRPEWTMERGIDSLVEQLGRVSGFDRFVPDSVSGFSRCRGSDRRVHSREVQKTLRGGIGLCFRVFAQQSSLVVVGGVTGLLRWARPARPYDSGI